MHSAIIALIATTAGFATAKPLAKQPECPSVATNTAYYVCGTNGFRGYCSVDPCAKPWCPDFKPKTCYPTAPRGNTTICSGTTSTSSCSGTPTSTITTTTRPGNTTSTSTSCSGTSTSTTTCSSTSTSTKPCPGTPTPAPRVCSGTAPYYNCANNGFRGACSVDPCALDWCPDYYEKTCNKVERPDPDTPCTSCSENPCTNCPKTTCTGSGAFYVCANNGFRGNCSVDPCALNWCPDYKSNTCEAAACAPKDAKSETGKNDGHETERRQDNGVCPEGTGYYQVCGNGFRGCCKADACGQASPICPNKSW